jgi:histidinol-phosphate aminotransferase
MSNPLARRTWLKLAGLGALGAGAGVGAGLPRLGAQAVGLGAVEPVPPEGKHINLAGNENPFGPAPAVVQAIFRAAPQSSRYPFREEQVLREMLAKKEGVGVENIVLGNGCDELLALAATHFFRSGEGELVATEPTYFQLPDYAAKFGATVRRVPHQAATMRHDLRAMAVAVGDATRLIYICNPDNPTGTYVDARDLAAFCREAAPRCAVFIDEVYLELLDDFGAQTQVPLVRAGLPVIVARSFSKLHGMAGHRIGYAVTTPQLAAGLARWQMSSLNFIGVAAARASLGEPAFLAYSTRKIREGRARFCALLDELGLGYTTSHGNFVFHQIGMAVADYQAEMKARGILVGWPHSPPDAYKDWCRTSIGTEAEMTKHAVAMREVIEAARAKS